MLPLCLMPTFILKNGEHDRVLTDDNSSDGERNLVNTHVTMQDTEHTPELESINREKAPQHKAPPWYETNTYINKKQNGCQYCKKGFAVPGHLQRHMAVHSGVKPYKCQQCDKAFMQSGHLKQHKRVHSGFKPYKCQQCDKAFAQSGNLKMHERIHSGVKIKQINDSKSLPMKCEVSCELGSQTEKHSKENQI